MNLVFVYILAALLFVFLLITLGFKPKFISRMNGAILVFVAIVGLGTYGYGYYTLYGGSFRTVMRTLFSCFCMFLGRNEIGAISSVPFLGTDGMQILIYAAHLLALYCLASAVLSTVGANLLRTLHLALIRWGDLSVVFGSDSNAIDMAEKLNKMHTTVVIDSAGKMEFADRVAHMGSLLLSNDEFRTPSATLLKKLGIRRGKRHYSFYCLDADPDKNIRFAAKLREVLESRGITKEQTSLTILARDTAGEGLMAVGGEKEHYGYGAVLAVDRSELVARMLVRSIPPYSLMRFNGKGHAEEDFEAVIIGFGNTGQAILKQLVMNGQFAGSRFRATVVSLDPEGKAGNFFFRYPGLKEEYDISFVDMSARSTTFYQFLKDRTDSLNLVVVCTGTGKENTELTEELTRFLSDFPRYIPVVQCSTQGIVTLDPVTGLPKSQSLYDPSVLNAEQMDAMAKILNHQYHLDEGRTVDEDWASCDYFSRMSCRASADYMDAFLQASGTNREEVRQKGWAPSPEVLEMLGQAEHLRWCAFHYSMGYCTMSEETFAERAALYREQTARGEKPIRISKDTEHRLHACLVSWDELPALSDREAEVTGVRRDYKKMDIDNVLMIPDLLREAEHD
ncbi:MAG: hypothetical protein J6Y95_04200 [Lachnospiraceae bacterium]|nr:hypothetical protein [Lachnospiraceae bacterium]